MWRLLTNHSWNFVSSNSPDSLELSGKTELLLWALTFLTSTWYIKNPFLKAKIVEVIPSTPFSCIGVNRLYNRFSAGRVYHMMVDEVSLPPYWIPMNWRWNISCPPWCASTLVGPPIIHCCQSSELISLVFLWSEVEQTGASSQFYDKFSEFMSVHGIY